jgi:hypothetical protein
MRFKYSILFSTLLFLTFTLAQDSYSQNRAVTAAAEKITGDRFKVTSKTPKGAKIVAVSKPSSAMLKAIDSGLADLFAVAKKNNYRKRLNYSDYTIYIANPDRLKDANGTYSPDIAVGAAQYAGTEYDKGGYIYAAGMVLDTSRMAFVIAEHTKNFNRVSDVVRFEGEHLVLYQNDRKRFNATLDHSKGGGHPILQ